MEEIAAPARIPSKCSLLGILMVHRGDDVQDLRRRALAALHAGVLPRDQPVRTWGGSGSGELCPVCGHAIEPAEKELEFEFAAADAENAVGNLHLHILCFAAFEFARESAAKEGADDGIEG